MKNILLLVGLLSMSSASFATENLVCKSADSTVQLSVKLKQNKNGALVAQSKLGDIVLNSAKTLNFKVLEGFSGDHDNNVSVQLTILDDDSTAVLIKQTYTERGVGYETEVTRLNCFE